MNRIRAFIRSGGDLTDVELLAMIKARVETMGSSVRSNWLRQLELSLDGYGGSQLAAADRVQVALNQLAAELEPSPPT